MSENCGGSLERLNRIYDSNVQWLFFAEAKNAAILVTSAGITAASLTGAFEPKLANVQFALINCALFSLLALIVSVVSFIPITNPPDRLPAKKGKLERNDGNPYFHEHQKSLCETELLNALEIRVGQSCDSQNRLIAHQIIMNAKIVSRKLQFFTASAYLLVSAFASPIGGVLIWMIVAKNTSAFEASSELE